MLDLDFVMLMKIIQFNLTRQLVYSFSENEANDFDAIIANTAAFKFFIDKAKLLGNSIFHL